MLQRNPRTLVEAKAAAREVDQLDKDYEGPWRKEDELIPQFISVHPRALEGERVRHGGQIPYTPIDSGPPPLAVRYQCHFWRYPPRE